MKLKYFTGFLVIVCIILSYRIFDMSVTMDYLKQDLADTQKEVLTIAKFQGMNCIDVEKIIDGVTIFRKEEKLIINGTAFQCDSPKGSGGSHLRVMK